MRRVFMTFTFTCRRFCNCLLTQTLSSHPSMIPARMAGTILLVPLAMATIIYLIFLLPSELSPSLWKRLQHPLRTTSDLTDKWTLDDVKVPVVLGVMSRCPDALLCESVFDDVLKEVGNKVNMSLSFIAKFVSF